jgi:hypothetical protein
MSASTSGYQQAMLNWKGATSAKPPMLAGGIHGPLGIIEKSREPLPYVLQSPEEQTDNWDDDFEEGISLTKLQGMDKTTAEDEKPDVDDNARTIRPNRSPSTSQMPLATAPSANIGTIVEDYSDLAAEEDDDWLQDKVAGFKVSLSLYTMSISSHRC